MEKTSNTSVKQSMRQSNIELLRIICMFMIVMHHFAVNVWYPGMLGLRVPMSTDEAAVLLSHCFFFIGVNCFVLISGYFSIKTSLKGFLHLYGFYVFYAFIIALTQYFGGTPDMANIPILEKWFHIAVHSLMPWDNNGFWFLNAYLALFLMAPLLNIAISNMTKPVYVRILVLLTILNVVLGNILDIDLLNTWGFCVAQFVYLYLIGGYLHAHLSIEVIKTYRWRSFGLYAVSALLWGILIAVQVYQLPFLCRFFKAFSYNNVFVLAAAIGFFLFMLSFDFKSRAINWFSSSCLAAYLLQGSVLPYGWYIDVLGTPTPLSKLILLPLVSALFVLVSLLFDKTRALVALSLNFLVNYFIPKVQKTIDNLYERF